MSIFRKKTNERENWYLLKIILRNEKQIELRCECFVEVQRAEEELLREMKNNSYLVRIITREGFAIAFDRSLYASHITARME